jgi:hypothetical protein
LRSLPQCSYLQIWLRYCPALCTAAGRLPQPVKALTGHLLTPPAPLLYSKVLLAAGIAYASAFSATPALNGIRVKSVVRPLTLISSRLADPCHHNPRASSAGRRGLLAMWGAGTGSLDPGNC